MTQLAPTYGQIRARVQAIRKKAPDARAVGIQSPGRYSGERLRTEGPERFRIEQCDSPLAARVALLDDEPDVTMTVLVTGLPDQELGEDVLVRLYGRKLYVIDSWQIVKELTGAQTIDPRLRSHGWIADRLLEISTAGSLPPAPSGYLDAEVVWPLLLDRVIGLVGERPDLSSLLRWSIDAKNVERFRQLSDECRQSITDWLAIQIGPAATSVLRCANKIEGPDAVPVGLVAGIVHHPQASAQLGRAAGRLDRFVGTEATEAGVLDRWHVAATDVIRLLDSDPRSRNQLLLRAEEILCEVQAEQFAYLSDVLPRGFDQRLVRLGDLLAKAIDNYDAGVEALREARDAVRRHDQARREPRRLERIEMARRLARWQKVRTNLDNPESLAEAARAYLDQSSFVDWARSVLRNGDPVRGLSEAYAALLKLVADQRADENRRFAQLLCDQVAAGRTISDPIPVERILDEVVAPLAANAPVLLILLDGMSAAVARELLADVTRLDWIPLGPEGKQVRPGLAAIPCVTEASRTSLFCGRPCTGAAPDEVTGFSAHPGLREHCRTGQPPVLFHKISLQEATDHSLASNVREAIASPHKRVVGVVVNAVDDHLLKGEQLDLRWTRDEIKVLPSLLYEARSARRVVVLLSDHGHMLDHQTEGRTGERSDGGERWRPDDGRVAEGEMAVKGPRVLLGDGHRLIAPWSERTRYGSRKNGYHGGLTPQEMLIPIAVLSAADLRLPGWAELPDPTPEWWEDALAKTPAAVIPAKPLPPPKKAETLWDTIEQEPTGVPVAEAPPEWVAALLASPLFGDQKRLAGRTVPADEYFGRLLMALDGVGGKMTAVALARRLEMSLFRLRTHLAVVQRVLNVDGYAVLGRDESSDTVELNRDLLLRQFDLLAGGDQ